MSKNFKQAKMHYETHTIKYFDCCCCILFISYFFKYGDVAKEFTKGFISQWLAEEEQQDLIAEELVQFTNKYNQQLPMLIDAETSMDTITSYGRKITYLFSLVNYNAAEIDSDFVKEYMKPRMINRVCTHEDTIFFRQNDIVCVYEYQGKNGGFVTSMSYNAGDCLKGSNRKK